MLGRFGRFAFRVAMGLALVVSTIHQSSGEDATTLEELIAFAKADPDGDQPRCPLRRDWVGDIRDQDGQVTKLRLEQGDFRDGKITLYRIWNDEYTGSEAPVYQAVLPKPEDLKGLKTLSKLERLFGPSRGFTDGWGSRERMNWTVSWVCFTREADDRLRYLSVFGMVSQADGATVVDVRELQCSSGVLRPANPDSKEELLEYPTGEALFLAEQDAFAKTLHKYRDPLRSFLAAVEDPEDDDLVRHDAQLNAVRADPNTALIRQLVTSTYEDASTISYLDTILGVPGREEDPELRPWKNEKRLRAIAACIDAIPQAPSDEVLRDLVKTLLDACGGGRATLPFGDRGGLQIDVGEDGSTMTTTDARPSTAALQKELRELLLKR